MKKSFLLVSILVIIGLMFSATQVLAAPKSGKPANSNARDKTPGPNQPANQNNKGNKNGKPQNFKGTVTDISATSLTLLPSDGTASKVFVVDTNTPVKIPTLKNATIELIKKGVGAIVQARDDGTGTLVVMKILVVPGQPTHFHRVGVVTAYTADTADASITIKDKDGQTTMFLLTPDTKILPKELASTLSDGVTVTIISRRDPTGVKLTAQGVVIHGPDETETGSENETETETAEGG